MKQKTLIRSCIYLAIIAASCFFSITEYSQSKKIDLSFRNVEALAWGEDTPGQGEIDCWSSCQSGTGRYLECTDDGTDCPYKIGIVDTAHPNGKCTGTSF